MKTTEEKIEVMQAHLRGEKIELLTPRLGWMPVSNPSWNWGDNKYRVAPEQQPAAEVDCPACGGSGHDTDSIRPDGLFGDCLECRATGKRPAAEEKRP